MPASQSYARIQSGETLTYKCLDYRAKRSSRSKCLIYGLRYTRYTETIYLHSYYMQIKLFCQQLGYQKAELVQHYQNTYIIPLTLVFFCVTFTLYNLISSFMGGKND